MTAAVVDPWAVEAPAGRFLYGLNPLAKFAAPVPAMILLVFVRDIATPVAFIALAYAVLLAGARLSRRLALLLLVALASWAAALDVDGVSVPDEDNATVLVHQHCFGVGNTALNKPSLRDSIALIERSPKPVLAVVRGVCKVVAARPDRDDKGVYRNMPRNGMYGYEPCGGARRTRISPRTTVASCPHPTRTPL